MRQLIRKLCRRSGLLAAAAVALLAAQAITVSHELDAADHEPGRACEVCLAASVFGGANVATPALPPTVRLTQPVDTDFPPLPLSYAPHYFRARAPPLSS
ncbi:MAG TPA: hypothetical protein VMR74_07165 [Gammaproteobacteria bacterium]|nr:hypothetical protein [Gammaproteobacteria bacterium]